MSNPVSRIDLNETEAAFLAANSLLVQQKKNRQGQVNAVDGDSNGRAVAEWADLNDDFILEWYRSGGGGVVPQSPVNVATVNATPALADTVTLRQNTVTRITWRVVGREDGQEDNAVYGTFTARYIDDAGVSALWDIEANQPNDYSPAATLTLATIAVLLAGNDVELRVTGEGGTNMTWQIKRIKEEFFSP